ncbi:MAG: anti-sigma factor, partial [Tunicatimonas sp.]|uniref:anti-sigma factor n=1 Tax=Tunicatimonas sp. TaxID=1940096 RepID=UPI003C72C34E
MNIAEYIASGILEIYVLGELPASEATEVETLAERYLEVREEIQRIEQTYSSLAAQTAVAPRPMLRDEILNKLAPESPASSSEADRSVETPEKSASEPRRIWPLQFGIAASLLFAILSAVAALYFRGQWREAEQQLDQVLTQNQEIASQYETATQRADQLSENLSVVTSPNFQTIRLAGTENFPNNSAQVYWNPTESRVYLNPGNLSVPPSDKQYQLWAIVDGKPVSAGLLTLSEENTSQLVAMNASINQASAFAITLEPQGGSEAPTMDQMYV